MPIDIKILDGEGSGKQAGVTKYNALKVTIIDPELLDVGRYYRYQFFSKYLTLGNDDVTKDMNIDGATSAKYFYYSPGGVEYDVYIQTLIFVMSDSTMLFKNFGSLSTLPNGIQIYIRDNNLETDIVDSAKTVGELIVKLGAPNAFGTGAELYTLKNYIGNTDALVIRMNMDEYVPGGIRLGRSSTDEICMVIKDNLTALDLLNVYVLGYRYYP